jgi:hypothetical protein
MLERREKREGEEEREGKDGKSRGGERKGGMGEDAVVEEEREWVK